MPVVSIRDRETGRNVTLEYLDARRDYLIYITAGLGFTFAEQSMLSPPSATALLQSNSINRPVINDMPFILSPNYIVYLMPAAISNTGSSSMTLAAGALRRSDTTFNRPMSFGIDYGFAPSIYFTDGVEVDHEGANPTSTAAWFSTKNVSSASGRNATITVRLTSAALAISSVNVSKWVDNGLFYNHAAAEDAATFAERMPGGLKVLGLPRFNSNLYGNTFEFLLDISQLPPGQYPITFASGILLGTYVDRASQVSTTRSTQVTAYLKIGPSATWRQYDAVTGAELIDEVLDAGRDVIVGYAVSVDTESHRNVIASFASSAVSGGFNTLSQWPNLGSTSSAALTAFVTGEPKYSFADKTFTLLFPLLSTWKGLAAGSYSLADAGSGRVCNGEGHRRQICTARADDSVLRVGFRPFASVFNGLRTNSYKGALDANGVGLATADDVPIPLLASTISVVFSKPSSGPGSIPLGILCSAVAWAVAGRATPSLPPPDTVMTADGIIVFTWSAETVATIPSGKYDIELRQGICAGTDGFKNARSIVRLVLGLEVSLLAATTSISSTGYDDALAAMYRRGVSGPFVTSATDAILRIAGMKESGFTFAEIISTATIVNASSSLPLSKSVLSEKEAVAVNSWTASTADGLRADYALSLVALKDGEYRLLLRNANTGSVGNDASLSRNVIFSDAFGETVGSRNMGVTFVIARTAPIGTAVIITRPNGAFFASGKPSGDIVLPQNLFTTTAVQPPSLLRLTIATADALGFSLRTPLSTSGDAIVSYSRGVFAGNASLTTGPINVAGPPGALVFAVRAVDEVGNVGIASVSLSVGAPPVPTITAIDMVRNIANNTVLTLSPSAAGVIAFSVRAVFPSAVRGATNSTILCQVGIGSGACATFTTQAFRVVSQTPAGVYAYVWDVTVGGEDVAYVLNNPNRAINLTIGGYGIFDTATAVGFDSSSTIRIRVDDSPPRKSLSLILELPEGTPGQFVAPLTAVVGVEYYQALPFSLFDDDFSPSQLGGVSISMSGGSSMRGFKLIGGPLGFAHIAGVPERIPYNRLFMSLSATDVAGNTAFMKDALQIQVIDSMPNGLPKLILSEPTVELLFTEGGAPIAFDQFIDMELSGKLQMSDLIDAVYVRLHSPEFIFNDSNSDALPNSEYLIGVDPCIFAPCLVKYDVDIYSGDGILSLRPSRAETWVSGMRQYTKTGNLTLGNVRNFLRSVRYVNTRTSIKTPGKRILVAQVIESILNPLLPINDNVPSSFRLDVLVASARRTLTVSSFNHAPVVVFDAALAAVAPRWEQTNPVGVPLLTSLVNVSDTDDATVVSASVQILLTTNAAYGGCDPARDFLQLFNTYGGTSLPALVYGVWYPSSCLLLLRPLPPETSVSTVAMKDALRAVVYRNLDAANPLSWNNAAPLIMRNRRVEVRVTDEGQGRLLTPTTSDVGVGLQFTIEPVTLPYQIDRRVIFGANGVLSSPDTAALVHFYSDAQGFIQQRKWPLVLPARGSLKAKLSNALVASTPRSSCRTDGVTDDGGSVVCLINLDLRAVSDRLGVFALGGISSPNNRNRSVDVDVYFLVGSTLVAGALTNGNAVALKLAGTDSRTSSTFRLSTLTEVRPGEYEIRLVLRGDTVVDGTFVLELVYALLPSKVSVQFSVDVRRAACTLPDAANYVGDAAIAAGNIYPIYADCVWQPTEVLADKGGEVTRGSFAADTVSLGLAAAAMVTNGISLDAQYVALATQRLAARGGFGLEIQAGAIEGVGTLAIQAAFADEALTAKLPDLPKIPNAQKSRIDLSLALKLGPAGTVFVKPIKVCMFIGDVESGNIVSLLTSSLVDPLDETKGFQPFEFLFQSTLIRTLGKLCGLASHFSIIVPLIVEMQEPPLADRMRLFGATCPIDSARRMCSAAGLCLVTGRCQCFEGFSGADCSLRKCPGAESWGQSEFFAETVPDAKKVTPLSTHIFTECAGRGACNRGTGRCSCFSGYEGGACERMSCPKKIVNSTDTFVYVTNTGDSGNFAEVQWESGFVAVNPQDWIGAIVSAATPCYGRGACRLLGELPAAVKTLYAPWAHTRVQKCVCDAPYTGGDCSQRICPMSADFESIGFPSSSPSVYQLSIDFQVYPTVAQVISVVDTEIALAVVFDDGRILQRTAAITNVWAGTADSAARIKGAIQGVPNQLGEGALTVTPVEATDPSSLSVLYDIASADGKGVVPLLSCAINAGGSMGCHGAACQPKFKQLRLLSSALPNSMRIATTCVLNQPPPVPGGLTDATTPYVWGVKTSLVIDTVELTPAAVAADPDNAVSLGVPSRFVRLTYSFQNTLIYGTAMRASDLAQAAWTTKPTPLPPAGLRANIAGPYGLVIDMGESGGIVNDLQVFIDAEIKAPWFFAVSWRLPVCSVKLKKTTLPVKKFVECGNKGLCDREKGQCQCFSGHEGSACERDLEST